MDYTKIIIRPVITEKANLAKEYLNQVSFVVAPSANKIEVKRAVEAAFNVKVEAVNILRKRPIRRVRNGRTIGKVAGYKKAFVTLAKGDKIEFFEGV
jgi:large subunit ribosomal protein L23